MKIFSYSLSLLSVGFCLLNGPATEANYEKKAKEAFKNEDYTESCKFYEKALSYSQNPGPLLVRLAVSYNRAQEEEKSFFVFLDALNKKTDEFKYEVDEQDLMLFHEALQKSEQAASVSLGAKEVIDYFKPIADDHPEYVLLNFSVALAQANLGLYCEFFQRFYKSYQKHPDFYLVDKTRSILHVKLMDKQGDLNKKEKERKKAIESILIAIKKNPKESNLYELAMVLMQKNSQYKEKRIQLLKNLIENQVILSRKDIMPYVYEAVNDGHNEIAQAVIDLAKLHYPYSRALQSAEAYLKTVAKTTSNDDKEPKKRL
ncbi:MAG: hypothetical protein JHC93_01635 [Parachlamydiales bacterium]|nr:hypothetical protein [Parachlamydiales bacterium]